MKARSRKSSTTTRRVKLGLSQSLPELRGAREIQFTGNANPGRSSACLPRAEERWLRSVETWRCWLGDDRGSGHLDLLTTYIPTRRKSGSGARPRGDRPQ